jgi:Cof subfamily protein (haloacid dehalogenase superfamily)
MIVTDLDRTLLRTDKTISDYSADILAQCRQRGMIVAFATARPERATKRFQDTFAPDYVIADNGATIHQGGAMIHSRFIPPATRDALISALRSAEEVSTMSVEAGHCVYTNYEGPPWAEGWNPVYSDFSKGAPVNAPKISAECQDAGFLSELLKAFPELHFHSNTGEDWYQIMRRDAIKCGAIQYIADLHGFSLEDVVAFGDDDNDIEMLTRCGMGVAVANAIAGAKLAADQVCGLNDDDGVAKWLKGNVLA